jgi:catechol 2,3-dioxygenase-like lactoylglutathione lyase family enzyme
VRTVELEAGLVCRDLAAMERFCTGVLGFETNEVLDFAEAGRIVKMRRGSARLKLLRPAAEIAPAAGDGGPWFAAGGWRYVALCVTEKDDVAALAAAVVAAGGQLLLGPVDHRPGASAALVTDPEGNAWELLWESAPGRALLARSLRMVLVILTMKHIIYILVNIVRWLQCRAKEDICVQ